MAVDLLYFCILLVWSGLMSYTFRTYLVSHIVSVLGSSEVREDLDLLKKMDSGITDLRTYRKVL